MATDRAFIERSLRVAIVASVAVAGFLALLWLLKAALTPLLAAFVIAYLFDPLIDRFEAHRWKRSAAIGILVAVMGVGVMGSLGFLVPRLIAEFAALGERLPGYLAEVNATLIPQVESWINVPVPRTFEDLVGRIRSGEIPLPLDSIRDLLERLLAFLTGTAGGIIGLLVVPMLAYYALVEFDHLKLRALEWVPPRHRDYVVDKAHTIDALVSGFLRGQLTVALVLGVAYAVGFSLIGIDLAVAVGLLAGLLSLVPYLGGVVAVTLATGLCVLKFGIDVHLLLVLGYYALVQFLEGTFLTPKIMGQSVGLHPGVVIVSLLIGGDLLGFAGLLVAVPLAAVVKVFVEEAFHAYRASSVFGDEAG